MSLFALLLLLFKLAIIGGVLYIIWWAITSIPMPQPIMVVVRIIFALVVAFIAISLILPMAGNPGVSWPCAR